MKSFSDFLTEEITHTIHKLPDGGSVYSHQIGDHQVQTHFYPRVSEKGNRDFDVHFIRKTKGSKGSGFSRVGIGSMSIEDRLNCIRAVKKSVDHFIENEKPTSLIASPNTKHKADWSHDIMNRIAKKQGGSVNRNANEISLNLNDKK